MYRNGYDDVSGGIGNQHGGLNPMPTYEGWTNYETWAVKLWLDNEEMTYRFWRARTIGLSNEAREMGGRWSFEDAGGRAISVLADELKAEHEKDTPEVAGVYADLLNAALSSVEWREIARALLDDHLEEGFWDVQEVDAETE